MVRWTVLWLNIPYALCRIRNATGTIRILLRLAADVASGAAGVCVRCRTMRTDSVNVTVTSCSVISLNSCSPAASKLPHPILR